MYYFIHIFDIRLVKRISILKPINYVSLNTKVNKIVIISTDRIIIGL